MLSCAVRFSVPVTLLFCPIPADHLQRGLMNTEKKTSSARAADACQKSLMRDESGLCAVSLTEAVYPCYRLPTFKDRVWLIIVIGRLERREKPMNCG